MGIVSGKDRGGVRVHEGKEVECMEQGRKGLGIVGGKDRGRDEGS